ncbi:MAG: threonine synthase [Bacilli bacterium]|nr:threonine synthase [Bacilli bacterium]MBN2877470.1 threonine synthase [Bacilli bacterium]
MTYIKQYRCTLCGQAYHKDLDLMTCPTCGESGILDIEFDYDEIKKVVNKEYFQNNRQQNIWRYLPFLTVEKTYTNETLSVGWTPLYLAKNLGKKYKTNQLYIKDDGLNPTQSLKDRASIIACVKAKELGLETISCSSTGNAASSLAGNAAKMGLKTVIFVPERAPLGKLLQLKMYGATLIKVKGDYKATFNLSKAAIDHYGWYNRNAAINPHLVEGKKTVALEIAEQLEFKPTDWVIVSVGDGCTVGGVYKGFYDLYKVGMIARIPKILGIQSEGCSPFVDAFCDHHALEEAEENTIADSIAVGIPRNPVKGMNAIRKSKGTYLKVSDNSILDAMKELASSEGIFAEPAAAASVSGYIKARKENIIKDKESVTIIITGNGLKDQASAMKTIKDWVELKPDLKQLIEYMKENEGDKHHE